jgi:hypothetical protein
MIDNELAILKDWRFVVIPYGEKGPKTKDWQNKPYTLEQVPDNSNIGVILGPQSNGILAIDFDGPWAWDYWNEHIKIDFNSFDTVMWTSNKVGRCQMAFRVPLEFWDYMPETFRIKGPVGDDNKLQLLEFRWGNIRGAQSVLPPSLHPDNKLDKNINYTWLRKPSEVVVQETPIELLQWIYDYNSIDTSVSVVSETEYRKNTSDEVIALAEELKRCYPVLDYDTWIRVTWAFCHELGVSDGVSVMKYHYPESSKGEYYKLTKSRYTGKKVTIGTIVKMIRDAGGKIPSKKEIRQTEYQEVLSDMELLKKIIKEKRNGREKQQS